MSRYAHHTSTASGAGFLLPALQPVTFFPGAEEFYAWQHQYTLVPMYCTVPVSDLNLAAYYGAGSDQQPSCLLESLTGSDNGRYSIIGRRSLRELSSSLVNPRGMELIRNYLGRQACPDLPFPFFSGGLIGYWAYEAGLASQYLAAPARADLPEQYFFVPGEILVHDRLEQTLTLICWTESQDIHPGSYQAQRVRMETILNDVGRYPSPPPKTPPKSAHLDEGFQVNIKDHEFCAMVEQCLKHIYQGDIIQVVISRRWRRSSLADPWLVFMSLRSLNPSPYMFYFNLPGFTLMGASPEMQTKVTGRHIKTRPIAGTRKVTGKQDVDQQLAEDLAADEKERAEHLMLVDLGRNDIGRVSQPGSVRVSRFMQVEPYSHVMHLVSEVEGQLREGADALDGFQACFPAGTLTGAPKRKAMEIISSLEQEARGPYGGASGFIGFNGLLDSCINIRSIVYCNQAYYLQSGAGIVADSVPELELEETLHKARALMAAIKEAEKHDCNAGQL